MKLMKAHARSVNYAAQLLRQTASNSQAGKPLDELRKHIENLEALEYVIRSLCEQKSLDFEKVDTISK